MKRLFIAVDISEQARNLAAKYIAELRARFSDLRVGWERPEKLHLTLKFLGDTGAEQIDEICDRLTEVAATTDPFRLRLIGNGAFPSRDEARVLWLGIDDAEEKLGRLVAAINKKLAGIGVEPDERKFSSHLTIARIREPRDSRALVAAHLATQYEPVEFEVSDLVLYESQLKPTGSVYFKLAIFPFTAKT
jgi:2'-5' RNA ligase